MLSDDIIPPYEIGKYTLTWYATMSNNQQAHPVTKALNSMAESCVTHAVISGIAGKCCPTIECFSWSTGYVPSFVPFRDGSWRWHGGLFWHFRRRPWGLERSNDFRTGKWDYCILCSSTEMTSFGVIIHCR